MSEEKIKFKVGDRVKLVAEEYSGSPENPVWRGKCGKIEGTIFSVKEDIQPIIVKWDNGEYRRYDERDLELITKEDKMTEIEELKETTKKCSERLEKLEKKKKNKYYLKLKRNDVAIGEGKIMLIVVDKNGNPVEAPHVLFITKEGTLKLEAFINPYIGLNLNSRGQILIG